MANHRYAPDTTLTTRDRQRLLARHEKVEAAIAARDALVEELVAKGASMREIARATGINYTTLRYRLRKE